MDVFMTDFNRLEEQSMNTVENEHHPTFSKHVFT